MQNILVTGGAGFIGSNFVRYLLNVEPNIRIINLDALTYAGSLVNLKDLPAPHRHIFIHGNICDQELLTKVFRQYEIDTIVHFAAETHVDRSIIEPGQFVETNIIGTFRLLETAREHWLGKERVHSKRVRFHHISTDEVFGTLMQGDPAWTEETPYAPNSPYAASKAASDHLVRSYGHTYDLPYTLTNSSNNYGPYQFPEKLIPLTILNALESKFLPVYGDGQQIRDWLHVEDHCEAIYLVMDRGTDGSTYNIGGGNQPANLAVVQTICDILDEYNPRSNNISYHELIRYVKDRPGHDRRYAMDAGKLERELGWQPRRSLTEGLRDTVEWYLSHPEWVAAIRKQQEYQIWLMQNYEKRESTP